MNNPVRVWVFLLLTITTTLLRAEPLSYAALADVTQAPERVKGSFNQVKYLAVLQAGIKSSGSFSYQRDSQIRWLTEQPVVNELVITPTALISRQGEEELLRLDTQTSPVSVIFGDILFSLLTADWLTLERYFSVTGELDEGRWQAVLMPVEETIQQFVTRVDVQGDTLLRQIVLYETNGDSTTITFQNLQF